MVKLTPIHLEEFPFFENRNDSLGNRGVEVDETETNIRQAQTLLHFLKTVSVANRHTNYFEGDDEVDDF